MDGRTHLCGKGSCCRCQAISVSFWSRVINRLFFADRYLSNRDAADKVVSGKGKLSELMAASHEIAAATAQLVVASRVKADPKSEKLGKLSSSSKLVTESTASVVATAEKLSSKLEESSDSVDFSKLNLHQAKKMEFESQVKLIELQAAIEKEHHRLASLRKKHYQLAGASEGWEQ